MARLATASAVIGSPKRGDSLHVAFDVPHRRTVPSLAALTIVAPSGLNATAFTQWRWPSSTRRAAPLAVSHRRTVGRLHPPRRLARGRPNDEVAAPATASRIILA